MDNNALARILREGRNFAQSASNSIAGNVSAPVDGLAWALRKLGAPIPANPVGGSDWMAEKGLTRPTNQNSLSGLMGEFAGMAGPLAVGAKAPQIAGGLLRMGENAAIPQTLSKQAGVFIGPGAKTWNAGDAARANALTDAGTDARQVWSETGTWKGPDGKWRQEIPDNAAGLRLGQQLDAIGHDKLSTVLDHKALYKGYPDLKNINTTFNQTAGSGSFSAPRDYAQYIDMPQSTGLGAKATPKQANSVALHEVQHAIQGREGWARGGSPEQFTMPNELRKGMHSYEDMARAEKLIERASREGVAVSSLSPRWADDKVKAIAAQYEKQANGPALLKQNMEQVSQIENPLEAYRRLAGEAEARATQARIPLNAAQRRATFPADSYDLPLEQLIIRQGLLK